MNEIIYAVYTAFEDLTNKNIIKTAILYGIVLLSIWAIIGYVIWIPLTSFTSKLLEFIPFSFIKSDGASMLSSIFFIQAIFITLAFAIIIFSVFISNDRKSKGTQSYMFVIFLITIVFWSLIWIYNYNYIHDSLSKIILWFPFETVKKSISYMFAIYILYGLFVVSLLIISSISSEKIINHISNREIRKKGEIKAIFYTLRNSLVFILVSILFFPILFIPIANVFIQVFVWIFLIKDTFTYDIGYMYFDKDELIKIKHDRKFAIYTISLIATIFNFLPIINIFSAFFGEFAMYHYFESFKK